MKRTVIALLAAVLAAFSFDAQAQNNFPTPGGSTAPGAVTMCNNGSGLYIPCAPGGGGGGGTVNTIPQCNGTPCGQLNPFFTVFAAGEFHVGEFGNNQTAIINPMTTSANTVTTGKSIGGLQTLLNAVRVSAATGQPGTSGNVLSTIISFVDPIGIVPFDVFYFGANPTASTCTDNTTFSLNGADRDKVFGIAHVTDINSAGIAQLIGPPIAFSTNNSTSIFACVVVRGSATITGTANASLDVRILRQ